MGMSSSQARLLSLTARQHDVEWRAQRLQADKLRLANDSDRVYNTYLAALSATKIQTRIYDEYEGDTFKDATLAMLENGLIPKGNPAYQAGVYSAEPLFLQEISTGRLMITPEYAKAIGVTGDSPTYNGTLDDFLTDVCGLTKTKKIVTTRPDGSYTKDPNTLLSFTPIGNMSYQQFQHNYTYEGAIANTKGDGFDDEELKPYAEFNDTHNSVSGTPVSGASSFVAGQTYTISSAADLNKLMTLTQSGQSTNGAKFVLTSDIDLSGYTWHGIENFAGTFDGNGYTISNLSGTQGLFKNTSDAVVKNVKLENINVNGNNIYVGGLIGQSYDTDITNVSVSGSVKNYNSSSFSHERTDHNEDIGTGGVVGFYYASGGETSTIDNVMNRCDVTGTGYNVGGVLGCYFIQHPSSHPNFNNAYSIGDITGGTNVGGITGYWKVDPDNNSNTDVSNIYSGGDIHGNTNVGGFTGVLSCWDDNGDTFTFTGIDTTCKISGNANLGVVIGNNNAVTNTTNADFIDCGYGAGVNPGMDLVGMVSSGTANIPTTGGGFESFEVAAKIPSIEADGTGGYYSNIYGALVKAGVIDPATASETEKTQISNKIKAFLNKFNNNEADNKKLYYLNEKLYNYLTGGADEAFSNALIADITGGTTTATAAWQTGADIGKIKRATGETSWEPTYHEQAGKLTIPHINTIRQNIRSAVKMAGETIPDISIDLFLDKYDLTDNADKASLAYVNDLVVNYVKNGKSMQELIDALYQGRKITKIPDYIDDPAHYTISVSPNDQSGDIQASENYLQIPNYEDIITWEWDWEDPEVQKGVAQYNALKGGFIIIGDTTQSADFDGVGMHRSADWLTNVIQTGLAQFVRFDFETGEIKGTSIANETSLLEVQNKEFLKTAEATYEKDMKKINKKEMKIDTELEELEAERTSIKTEQDSLKKVINDNIDLSFKLFS